ncbi:hypothetical protein BO82DRAFT_106362 [Aspergillus uvarum CBS 121591]|uniref:Uncharacterized protein n=1 Tax=Aspergillus uvarum CBS 121591 TaxID=1448315 RepID=A0A319CPI0_9EURO|nr:hypothetical protein BO82DRAFT_106362 [Aspergillus uvarum CBS 121591]PYH80653.1 hypothetical protein BO82DRAFT_106362 [Aspergillus uvarum CBS 121591]
MTASGNSEKFFPSFSGTRPHGLILVCVVWSRLLPLLYVLTMGPYRSEMLHYGGSK